MIEINGTQYEQINRQSKSAYSKFGTMTALLVSLMPTSIHGVNSYSRKRPNVDIVEEYKLILQKKSTLSKSDRDWVVGTFKYNFREVTPEETKRAVDLAETIKKHTRNIIIMDDDTDMNESTFAAMKNSTLHNQPIIIVSKKNDNSK
jgi:ABC-type branched-subunit amino acid transport system substrate-binding protein